MSQVVGFRSTREFRRGSLMTIPNSIPYREGWALQQHLHTERMANRCLDTLLLLQHEPVYTMGRRTSSAHFPGGETVLRNTGAAVEYVNRGGSITYHGPGQLVGYPILSLVDYVSGPREYVGLLEEVLIRTLALWSINAYRIYQKPGVFVRASGEEAKIASIGVRVERGITLHGFSLNLDLDLAPFSCIIPCGLTGCRAASIALLRETPVSFTHVAQQVSDLFGQVFNLAWRVPRCSFNEPERLEPVTALTKDF